MVYERSGGRYVLVPHDFAVLVQLVDMNQRNERHPPLIGDTRLDVRRVHFEEQPGHLLERWGDPRVDSRSFYGGPSQPEQVAVIGVMVRVMVREEDVPKCWQR